MARVTELAADHPLAATIALSAVAFTIASTIARFHAVHTRGLTAIEPTPEAEAVADEPARLRALRDAHDDTTREALSYLTANVWESASGTVVEFTDECIRTRGQGDESWEPYAVCASSRRQEGADGVTDTVWVLCVETVSWSELLTLTAHDRATPDGPPAHPTVECAGIAGGGTLTASEGLRPLAVEGPDEATLEAHGTTSDEVGRALAAWCADWRPTARTATWDETILEDHERRSWDIHYDLDDRRQSAVTVAIDMDTHEVEVREGRQ